MEKFFFKSFDNTEHLYRGCNYDSTKKTLIIIHRGHEHSERLDEFITDERFQKYNIFSYDLRGHGYTKAEASPIFMDYVRDLNAFVTFLKGQHSIVENDIFIVASSIGAVILTAWIHDFAPDISGVALLAPAFKIKLYIPFAKEFTALLTKFNKNAKVPSYVKSKVLTHDVIEQKKYDSDKLITKDINAKLLVDFLNYGEKLVAEAAVIETPTIIFSAGKDYVVSNTMQKKFYLNMESELKEFVELKDFYHGIIFEKERKQVYETIDKFIIKSFEFKKKEITTNPEKFTQKEYETIMLKAIPLCEKTSFKVQKFMLNSLGWLSNGMSIGLKYGFDSGVSLNYVYKNTPNGKLGIGKLIDKSYLNEIGWQGIRRRKVNLLELVRERINSSSKETIRILDVAGGVGNYLFDIKKEFPNTEIIINEFKKENIIEGEQIIKERNLENIKFSNMDCFDFETYKKLDFTPDIVIISGIFELFNDNEMLKETIRGVNEILSEDGCVLYTGQPWHPQLYKIAFVLNSLREGNWVMRRRTQRELDNIFKVSNFEKKKMLLDDFGIFTISLAEKRSN